MQNPNKRHKLTSDNSIIKFKKPVHDPFKVSFDCYVDFSEAPQAELLFDLSSTQMFNCTL